MQRVRQCVPTVFRVCVFRVCVYGVCRESCVCLSVCPELSCRLPRGTYREERATENAAHKFEGTRFQL